MTIFHDAWYSKSVDYARNYDANKKQKYFHRAKRVTAALKKVLPAFDFILSL